MIFLRHAATALAVILSCTRAFAAPETAEDRRIQTDSTFLEQLQERDSVLIADQLYYGVSLGRVQEGTRFVFPDWNGAFPQEVEVLAPWTIDTLSVARQKKGSPRLMDLRAKVLITSFKEGKYELPEAVVTRISSEGVVDTLVFSPQTLDVRTIPVDTATFSVHDIKGQIRYPLTFREILPWIGGILLLAGIVALVVWLVVRARRKSGAASAAKEPAHIIALRKLDSFRGDRLWVPEKQKVFYSGITDTLREYIVSRYGISAMEMTTKEIFDDLSGKDVPKDIYEDLKQLFERADYVKFAKYVATNEENASSVPLAVRFVTTTYQEELATEQTAGTEDNGPGKTPEQA